jgi:hypothetical protein
MPDTSNRYCIDSSYGLTTSNTPVHPGTAKQVTEPAILWFVRRVRRMKPAPPAHSFRLGRLEEAGIIQQFLNSDQHLLALPDAFSSAGAFGVF